MKVKQIFIKKHNQEVEPFLIQKLEQSLQSSGATKDEIETILFKIESYIYDGITSNEIFKKAFTLLKNSNSISASRYSLKRAIFELGPTGYPFERMISALLNEKGFKTSVDVILKGESITHEIDVLAEKEGYIYML